MIAPYGEATKTLWAQWDSLRERNGVLHRCWECNNGKETTLQLIVLEAMRPEVLLQVHSTRTAGHFGVNKTLKRLQQHFYWPGCGEEVRKFCKECDLCSSRKGPRRKPKAPMQIYRVGLPMERIAIDVLGPLPESNRKYLLIAMDYFTKWPEAYPLPNQEAITVGKVLVEEMVCRFGVQ